ncbi:MAG: beta-glucosidase [Anaerolineae bacterium]|nr:beta-glucosidase [Anaerolineae bacterium]
MGFPSDFLWGAATASYQIEGAAQTHGRGECIWTRFSHTPGKVQNGDTGDAACEHYFRYQEDVALMRELGLQAYRFSISWPRVIPAGTGKINTAGLDFYDRLTDELLKAGIQPWATLYHWDLPQVLEDKGGWTNPDVVKQFADYTDLMTRQLGDRIHGWITLNEPWCSAFLGYMMGVHAPGLKDDAAAYKAAHYLLLAHGEAMPIIRRNAPQAKAGITLNLSPHVPATDSEEDAKLAQLGDGFGNRWFLDPLFKGVYPADMVEIARPALEGIDLAAVKVAAAPNDFLGINYYMRFMVTSDPTAPGGRREQFPPDAKFTEMGWEIYPQGMADMLLRVHKEYGPIDLYITENGAAFPDPAPTNGVVEDSQRVDFLKGYLAAAESAIAAGAPLKGYFVWSLLDNFEWALGYSRRFGVVHVDFKTQQRTLKRSALYYRDLIAASVAQPA